MSRRWAVALTVPLLVLPLGAQAADGCLPSADDPMAAPARTDHRASGNRVAGGCGPLGESVVDVELGGRPRWVLPDPADRGDSWLVVLDDGSIEHVVARLGERSMVRPSESPPLRRGDPPLASITSEGRLLVDSALTAADSFADPVPGARVVEGPDGTQVALTAPTDRYDHGVLGDGLEATAVTLRDPAGGVSSIEMAEHEVIEGLTPIAADLDGDGEPEIVVTISSARLGAGLAAFGPSGEPIGRSEPIGQGYRWLHQVGVGGTGPGGEIEIIAVRTPHIGGTVEAYRLVDGRLELVAAEPGYSSHQLGSANLDMALLADADGDGRLDVIVPSQEMSTIAALARSADGFESVLLLPLEGTLGTNVAATADAAGRLVLAAGTEDGRLRIFR